MKNVISISVLAMLLWSCGGASKDKTTNKNQVEVAEKTKKVKVMTIEKQTIGITQEYTATIAAFDKVYLAPTMPGRIVDIKVEVNDAVKKNQEMVLMDDAQLLQLRVQYENLKKEMGRMDTLIAYGSVSQQVYDQTKAQYLTTEESYKNLQENTRLLAPFSGIVTNRLYENNEIFAGAPNTSEGKAAIVIIEKIDKLKVKVNMSARFFPLVRKGMKASLVTDIYPGATFTGNVSLVYPTIDPSTRTFPVEIIIPNADLKLRPGMYSKVKVKLDEKETLVVPSSVVLMQEGTSNRFIFIAEGNKAKRVAVELGERFDEKLEIISDIDLVGKQVVVTGQSKLDNGDLIEIK